MGDEGSATNPCELIERYPEHKRERFLSGKELQRLGSVLTKAETEQTESRYAVAAFRLLLLTGCRLSEIQKLEWRHVDTDSGNCTCLTARREPRLSISDNQLWKCYVTCRVLPKTRMSSSASERDRI